MVDFCDTFIHKEGKVQILRDISWLTKSTVWEIDRCYEDFFLAEVNLGIFNKHLIKIPIMRDS